MKFSIAREDLLKPLQQVIGAVERRQTLAALGNVLIRATNDLLELTATDLEVELQAKQPLAVDEPGEITVPARKLLDICKALPEEVQIEFSLDKDRAVMRAGRSRFTLSTLPASEFPVLEDTKFQQSLTVSQQVLKSLIERTAFAMANQDVRYYLNGLLLDADKDILRAVATDGHRLALCEHRDGLDIANPQQVIIPRKSVMELQRLLDHTDEPVTIQLGANHIRIELQGLRFTSKLIDGRFPDFNRVLPQDTDKTLSIDREVLRQALSRASILSNEKYRGIRLMLGKDAVRIQAHNPEQEEAEEELSANYQGGELEIGFNVNYLIDVLSTVTGDTVEANFKDANSSTLLYDPKSPEARFVVMPMRL
ncbi:MAG: DNA polymerase III subunit beta [Gammaproteobacteria bacterium]|jgi:DNA polymerase-3 subunit beta